MQRRCRVHAVLDTVWGMDTDMKEFKKQEKQYIYFRDRGSCTFCGKELQLRQTSLDHYLPKSKGGPDAVYNIVLSCKTCNKLKKSSVPGDYAEVMIKLLKKGVRDKKITGSTLKIRHQELEGLVEEVDRVEHIGEYTAFQSPRYRFYIEGNKIVKMVQINGISSDGTDSD